MIDERMRERVNRIAKWKHIADKKVKGEKEGLRREVSVRDR